MSNKFIKYSLWILGLTVLHLFVAGVCAWGYVDSTSQTGLVFYWLYSGSLATQYCAAHWHYSLGNEIEFLISLLIYAIQYTVLVLLVQYFISKLQSAQSASKTSNS